MDASMLELEPYMNLLLLNRIRTAEGLGGFVLTAGPPCLGIC
jgi:hypothetical protein